METQAVIMQLDSINGEEVLTKSHCYLFKFGFAAYTYCSLEHQIGVLVVLVYFCMRCLHTVCLISSQ